MTSSAQHAHDSRENVNYERLSEEGLMRPWTAVEQQWDEMRQPSPARYKAGIALGLVLTGCYVVAAGFWIFR